MILALLVACAGDDAPTFPSNANDTAAPSWSVGAPERLFTGGYADASVLRFGDRDWMYLNSVVEEPSGTLLYTSDDGAQTWTQETPVIFGGVATGRAVAMDGGVRFVYPARGPAADQGQPPDGEISLYSAWSADGVAFDDDPGARVGPELGEPGGPALWATPEGGWRLYFDVSRPSDADPAVDEAAIWGASSADGLDWTVDEAPSLEAAAEIEGVEPAAQVLHPCVFDGPDGAAWMIYNAHAALYLARSADGLAWEKLGALGLEGADASVLELEAGLWRLWFGTWSEATGGEIWTTELAFSAP